MTGGVLANGTKVAYSLTSPVSWVKITQLLTANLDYDAAEVDVTTHGDSRRKSIPGLPSAPRLTIRALADLDPTSTPWVDDLFDLEESKADAWWRVEYPTKRDGTQFRGREFQGRVLKCNPLSGDPNDRLELEIIVTVTSDMHWDLAAGPSEIS
jgi:hypothetical protein